MNILRNQYEKTCPNCGDPFTAKRLNQDYCSADCRVQFNNHQAIQNRATVSETTAIVNAILLKNREVLRRLSEKNEQVSLMELTQEGFQTNYITYFEPGKHGETKFFCYDYGYIFLNEKTLKIIQE